MRQTDITPTAGLEKKLWKVLVLQKRGKANRKTVNRVMKQLAVVDPERVEALRQQARA